MLSMFQAMLRVAIRKIVRPNASTNSKQKVVDRRKSGEKMVTRRTIHRKPARRNAKETKAEAHTRGRDLGLEQTARSFIQLIKLAADRKPEWGNPCAKAWDSEESQEKRVKKWAKR